MGSINKRKISELPVASTLDGFITLGVDNTNKSVQVPIEMLRGNKGDKGDKGDSGDTALSKYITNVSQLNNKYDYADKQAARNAVPSGFRAFGQIVSYKLASGDWVTEQYIGTTLDVWATDDNWKLIGRELPDNTAVIKNSGSIDLTADSMKNLQKNISIQLQNNGMLGSWSGADTIVKYKLKPNQRYRFVMSDIWQSTWQGYPLNFYNTTDNVARSSGLTANNGDYIIDFTTNTTDLYICFYYEQRQSGTGYGIFNNQNYKLYELIGTEDWAKPKTDITDNNGVVVIPDTQNLAHLSDIVIKTKLVTNAAIADTEGYLEHGYCYKEENKNVTFYYGDDYLTLKNYPLARNTTYRFYGGRGSAGAYAALFDNPKADLGNYYQSLWNTSNANGYIEFTTPADTDLYLSSPIKGQCGNIASSNVPYLDISDFRLEIVGESDKINVPIFKSTLEDKEYTLTKGKSPVIRDSEPITVSAEELTKYIKQDLDFTGAYPLPLNTRAGYAIVAYYPLKAYRTYIFEGTWMQYNNWTRYFHLFKREGVYKYSINADMNKVIYTPNDNELLCFMAQRQDTPYDIRDFDPAKFKMSYIDHSVSVDGDSVNKVDIPLMRGYNQTRRQLDVIETDGHIGWPNGIYNNNTTYGGRLAKTTEMLKPNTYYLITVPEPILGRIYAILQEPAGLQNRIAVAGRKNILIYTGEKSGYLWFMYKVDYSAVTENSLYDFTGKYKIYELNQNDYALIKGNSTFPIRQDYADHSNATELRIPTPEWCILNVYEDYTALTKDKNYRGGSYVLEYFDSNNNYFKKYADIGGQGSSSMGYFNKNSKFKMTNADGSKFLLTIGDWMPISTIHLKVYWVDFSMASNNGAVNFVTDWYRDRTKPTFKYYPYEPSVYSFATRNQYGYKQLYNRNARFCIDGIPCGFHTFRSFYCNGSLNLRPDYQLYALDPSNPLHRGYRGNWAPNVKANWEEMITGEEGNGMSTETYQPLLDFYNWYNTNRSAANIDAFKEGAGIRYDIQEMIDYWLLMEWWFAYDNGWNNMVWITYDSVLFHPGWYDLDSHSGHHALDGNEGFQPDNANVINVSDNDNRFYWEPIIRAYPNEIAARYAELRKSGRFSGAKYREIFSKWQSRYYPDWFDMDYAMWRERLFIKNLNQVRNIEQDVWWVTERLAWMDNKYGYTE